MNRILPFGAFVLVLSLAGCSGESPAEPAAVAASAEKAEPAFVEGLPRDQWLTAASALPLNAEGAEVRDEKRRPYSYALLGRAVPAFSAELVGGGAVSQEIFRGKWTIVDVWGIWCGDCRRDGPLVKTLAQLAEADPDIDFLSLHTPPNRKRAAEAYGAFGSVEAYFESQGGGYPTIVDKDASVREALNIVWTPTYLLIDPDLTVRAFRTDLSVGSEDGPQKVLQQARDIRSANS